MADAEVVEKIDNGNGHKSEEEVAVENVEDGLTKLERDIIRQVEYYFGESNMRRDKFLRQKIEENTDKWVPISVLLTFNRLKALTEDPKVVAETLLKSSNGVIEVSDDKEKIRRHPDNPLPEFNEARRKELMNRTAYAKGFPLDSKMDTLIEYFNNNFEKVENVIMRKYFQQTDKAYYFKGSVFVLFENKESAEKFVKKEDLKYGEKVLLRYMQEEYFKAKKQEIKEKSERRRAHAKEKEAEGIKVELPKNAILHFVTEAQPTLRREDFKKRVFEIDPSILISFIHYDMGDKEGDIRFSKDNDGVNFLEKLGEGHKITANGTEFTMSLVEGEKEEEFLKKAVEDMQRARAKLKNQSKGKRKHEKDGDVPRKQAKLNDEEVPAVAE